MLDITAHSFQQKRPCFRQPPAGRPPTASPAQRVAVGSEEPPGLVERFRRPGGTSCRKGGSELAGAGANRTHQDGSTVPVGFEDRGAHQRPFRPHVLTPSYQV